MVEVKVTYQGPLFEGSGNIFVNKMKMIANEIAEVVTTTAQARFLELKVTLPKEPSAIVDSFDSTPPKFGSINEVRTTVFAGAPIAPHIVFLVKDRELRNKKMWSSVNSNVPYDFMKVGRNAGEEAATGIVKKYF